MEKLFKLKEHGTTVGTEVRAGFTTFIAMAYIIFLNPIFLSVTGMSSAGVLAATCISAAAGTLLSALLSNRPFAMASGMGMNAYFAYTLCVGYGYTWQQALAITFISGVIFLILAILFGKRAITFIPENIRHAITAGIGLFIMLIGLLDAGLIQMTAGYPEMGNLGSLPVLTSLIGLIVIMILTVLRVRGSLIIGMLITAIFSLVTGQTSLPQSFAAFPTALRDVCFQLDFAGLFSFGEGNHTVMSLITIILTMSIVDMFDTLGFLIGTVSKTDDYYVGQKSEQLDRVMIADAGSTIIGSILGTSTVTVYAESAAGIEAGGRTGLTAFTTAGCFLLAVFFSPVVSIFNSSITAPALIVVGMYLLMDIKKVSLGNMDDAIPALLTMVMMPMAYSITAGIAAGFISFVLCKIAARKFKELSAPTIVLGLIFVLYFYLS